MAHCDLTDAEWDLIEALLPSERGRDQPCHSAKVKPQGTYILRLPDLQGQKRIERMFNKVKQFRRIATRYDKSKRSFAAFLNLAAAHI